jgi:hypothetical protein
MKNCWQLSARREMVVTVLVQSWVSGSYFGIRTRKNSRLPKNMSIDRIMRLVGSGKSLEKSRSRYKNLGSNWIAWSKFHSEDPHALLYEIYHIHVYLYQITKFLSIYAWLQVSTPIASHHQAFYKYWYHRVIKKSPCTSYVHSDFPNTF